jgi:ribosomal protein L37AE/L43A
MPHWRDLSEDQRDVDYAMTELVQMIYASLGREHGLSLEECNFLVTHCNLYRIFNHHPKDGKVRDRAITQLGIKMNEDKYPCENCGNITGRKNKWGIPCCGDPSCLKTLARVGKSKDHAEWCKKQNNPKSTATPDPNEQGQSNDGES